MSQYFCHLLIRIPLFYWHRHTHTTYVHYYLLVGIEICSILMLFVCLAGISVHHHHTVLHISFFLFFFFYWFSLTKTKYHFSFCLHSPSVAPLLARAHSLANSVNHLIRTLENAHKILPWNKNATYPIIQFIILF